MKIRFIRLNLALHGEEVPQVGGIGTAAIDSRQTAEPIVVYGKQPEDKTPAPSVAPVEPVVDRNTEWKTAKDKYKDLYEPEFKGNMDRRLKSKNTEIGTMKSVLDPFLKYFGKASIAELKEFIDADIVPQLEGYTPTAYDPDADNGEGVAPAAAETPHSAADLANESIALSEKLKAQGVTFDLQTEIDNPAVGGLLKKGLNLEQAYTLVHHDEILLRETQKVAAAQKAATIESIRTKGIDAVSEVASKPAPKVIHKVDPRTFTPKDMEDIKRRVNRGEEISL